MARIELSAEIREIEDLIDAGQQGEASSRIERALPTLGRRPEYRYLRSLYDSTFRVRSDRDLLAEVKELAGEQPDLLEAAALLALLCSRTGDDFRADLFGHLALDSNHPATRARAMRALRMDPPGVSAAAPPAASRPTQRKASLPPPPGASSPAIAPPTSVGKTEPTEIDEWFIKARRELVYRRTPTYGVLSSESIAETLLDWGKAVATGKSDLSPAPLPLCRASLVKLDEIVLASRRALGRGNASKSDTTRVTAIAGFLTAVVLHELGAAVYETAATDGGCKLVLPSGAGTRPLLAASAAAEGTGASLTQLYDRLAMARDLAGPATQRSMSRGSMAQPAQARMSWRPLAASNPAAPPSVPPLGDLHSMLDTLAMTRHEVEACTVKRIDKPRGPADPPPIDLGQISAAFVDSPLGQTIARRSGVRLSPTPSNIEAVESYCSDTYGDRGIAPNARVWEPPAEEQELILGVGACLGETLIATYGGIWECDTNSRDDPRLFRVICQEKVVAWPITRAYMRLKNGAAFNIADLIAEVGTLLAER